MKQWDLKLPHLYLTSTVSTEHAHPNAHAACLFINQSNDHRQSILSREVVVGCGGSYCQGVISCTTDTRYRKKCKSFLRISWTVPNDRLVSWVNLCNNSLFTLSNIFSWSFCRSSTAFFGAEHYLFPKTCLRICRLSGQVVS
jgi:hypothetical protein